MRLSNIGIGITRSRRASAPPARTSLQSSVTYDGVTFNFDKPVPVGETVRGEPFALSTEAFNITSITPLSTDLNSDGFIGNGAMQDPFIRSRDTAFFYADAGAVEQGFDEYIASGSGGLGSANTPYNGALNISSVSISVGQETSIVKSVRKGDVANTSEWQTFEKFPCLTVLSELPPVGFFQPTASGLTKRIYTTDSIDMTVFRSITLPASFTDTITSISSLIPEYKGDFGSWGELLRRFRLDVALGTTTTNYSGDLAGVYAKALILLHSDAYTDAEKRPLLYKILTWGIQLEGMYDRGWRGHGAVSEGAGQHGLFAAIMYTTAFAFGSASLLAKARDIGTPFKNAFWVNSSRLNIVPGEDTGYLGQPFISEDTGVAHISSTSDIGSQFWSRYGAIASRIISWEGAAVALLQNGPGNITGFDAVTDGAFDETNDDAAIWAYLDRYATIDPYPGSTWATPTDWRDLWSQVQGLGVYTPWTGVPEQLHNANSFGGLPYEGEDGDRITATADGYSWDVSDHDYSTEAVTSVDFRYSLDGVQYVENIGASATGSVTGLLKGVSHHVGLRFVSASGTGPWSQNWPLTTGGEWADTDRNAFSTIGTPTAAIPAFTTSPEIHYKRSPQWAEFSGNWLPAPSTLDANDLELACGLGYVSGEAAPSFTFQWNRDGVAITGETAQKYTRTSADAGTTLTCTVTPSNSAGTGTAVTTAGIAVPAIATPPTGTLIDTEFKGAFAFDYASELASVVGTGCNILHKPVAYPVDLGENPGALHWDKTADRPDGYFDLSRAADTATEYTIDGEFLAENADNDTRDVVFTVEEVAGSPLFTETIAGSNFTGPRVTTKEGYDFVKAFSGTFTTGSITDLRVNLSYNNPTGGAGGGDMYLTKLKIVSVAPVSSAPTIESQTVDGLNAGEGVVALDLASSAENDLVVICLYSDNGLTDAAAGTGTDDGLVSGQGWTTIANPAASTPGHVLAYKFMGAAPDTSVNVECTGSRGIEMLSFVVRGANLTTPIDNSFDVANGATGNPDAPAHTTLTDNALRLAFGLIDDVSLSLTAPTGWTTVIQAADAVTGNDANNIASAIVAKKSGGSAGTDNPDGFTSTGSDEWYAYHLAIRPL